MLKPFHALTFIFFGLTFSSSAIAAENEDVLTYRIAKGDTLIALADKYMLRATDFRIVQKHNRIADPLKLTVGREISIPRSVLKYQTAKARVISVRGEVFTAGADGPATPASNGQILSEGSAIATSVASFATLQLDDGSKVSLPSNSKLGIRLLRKYVLGGAIDYDFAVEKGGARSSVIPAKSTQDRYRVRTPKAVSAVRGTDFQSRYDDATGMDFAEVVEGALAVGGQGQAETSLPAGNGLAMTAKGNMIKEVLLPAPELDKPGRLQADVLVKFRARSATGAAGQRFALASDAGFVEQLADQKTVGDSAEFSDLPNGNYFIRARSISANGIEGMPVTYAFKRRLNSVGGAAGKGDEGFAFKWTGSGEGVRRYHFQLFKGSPSNVAIVDEPAIEGEQVILSDLPPGDYFWRVGAKQHAQNEYAENWMPFEKLSVAAP